jgi:hypothetical protein
VCPLTWLENWLESLAGVQPYQGGFLLHYLDALVYPDISGTVLMTAGVAACLLNLGVRETILERAQGTNKSQRIKPFWASSVVNSSKFHLGWAPARQ